MLLDLMSPIRAPMCLTKEYRWSRSLNIHYGQDTSGVGRFAPQAPVISANNPVINATLNGAACTRRRVPVLGINGSLGNATDISKDCLTLKIVRPSSVATSENLSVMVWFLVLC